MGHCNRTWTRLGCHPSGRIDGSVQEGVGWRGVVRLTRLGCHSSGRIDGSVQGGGASLDWHISAGIHWTALAGVRRGGGRGRA